MNEGMEKKMKRYDY